MKKESIIIVSHGSSIESSNLEFEKIVFDFQIKNPDCFVSGAYLEKAEPDLFAAIEKQSECSSQIIILPCFLFEGGHVLKDLPLLIDRAKTAFPEIEFVLAKCLGHQRAMIDLLLVRAQMSLFFKEKKHDQTAVLVVAHGNRNDQSAKDFFKIVESFNVAKDWALCEPGFLGAAEPSYKEVLGRLSSRYKNVLLLPYFLFEGALVKKIISGGRELTKTIPGFTFEAGVCLGHHELLLDTLQFRYEGIC